MPGLLDKRLLIFSGKGGVGKTVVSCAVAVAAARQGKRVLVLEYGEDERVPAVFGAKKSGYAGGRVWAGDRKDDGEVWSLRLTARDTLHEFVIRQVKFERIYDAVFENRVIKYFTTAAPGLNELVVMGKIENLAVSLDGKASRKAIAANGGVTPWEWDLIVFDAPATGHGLAFFKVPKMTMEMVRVGPLYRKSEAMWELLTDEKRTAFNVVTLAEEMPVNESIELHAAAKEMGLPEGKVIVNAAYPPMFDDEDEKMLRELDEAAEPKDTLQGRIARAALDAAIVVRGRQRLHDEQIARLSKELPAPRVELPFLFEPRLGTAEIVGLAKRLEESL